MDEIWKEIEEFNGRYKISNTGKIKSIYNGKEKFLTPQKDRYGYLTITLSKDGAHKRKKLHRLVAEAFIPNPNNLPQINHKNGDKEDNNVDNLEWCTAKDNLKHALETGLRNCVNNTPHYGEENGSSKITKEIANEIRSICILGDPQFGVRALARKYNLGVTTVGAIVHNKTWKN